MIEKLIIDKYENSTKFRKNEEGNLSLNLMGNKTYFNLELDKRLELNEKRKQLHKKGLIPDIKWIDYNNLIERVYFNTKNIDYFYKTSGLKRKRDTISDYTIKTRTLLETVTTQWIQDYLISVLNNLNQNHIPSQITKSFNLYKTLKGLDDINGTYMLERVFSKKYLNNSKIFREEVEPIIISIVKKYNSNVTQYMSDSEVLAEIGIVRMPTELHIKGDLAIKVGPYFLDLSEFKYGIPLNSDTLREAEIVSMSSINRVIILENKTNFAVTKYSRDTLYICSQGYFSPVERDFLKKIEKYSKEIREIDIYHSGDIDLGGFNIFKHIKDNIFPDLKPYNMNIDIYNKYLDYAEDIPSNEYKSKLEKLDIPELNDLIKEVVKKGYVLEQEAFLI